MTTHLVRPEWNVDLAFGHIGEKILADLLHLDHSKVEVKYQRLRTQIPRLFVEVEQKPADSENYKPSGLTISTADVWCFIFESSSDVNHPPVVIVATWQLREIVERRSRNDLVAGGSNGNNPTRGYLISVQEILNDNWNIHA